MIPNRRRFIQIGAASTGALLISGVQSARALAAACGLPTAPQTQGPFYPGASQFTSDTDLTYIPGHAQRAKGQVVIIRGQVIDAESCKPLAGANVEIWQACESGRYNNSKDPNPAPIDPDFKYWGETLTDSEGRYAFRTIIPGAYPADTGWVRPPHVHYKVSKLGYRELVTQMYFKGNRYNDADLILGELSAAERKDVIVEFVAAAAEPGVLEGAFDVSLVAVRR